METESYTSYGTVPFSRKEKILFLIVEHSDGHWGFPKGHQDEGEAPIETARRELYEETGVSNAKIIENIKFEEYYDYEDGNKIFHKKVEYFLAEVESGETRIPEEFEDEIKNSKWVSFDEGMKTLTFEEARDILQKAKERIIKDRLAERIK